MKYKTIIFDFDGTIANTLPFTFKKILEIARSLKLSHKTDQQVLKEIRSKTYRQLMKEYKLSWLKLPWVVSMTRKTQTELTKIIDRLKPFPDIKSTLAALKRKKIKLGILTSNIEDNVNRFISANNLPVFDFIHCERNFFGKDIALKNLIQKYRLDKNSTIYVGDELRDIEACKKIGIKIVAVGWGFNTEKLLINHNPDYFINQPKELLSLVKSF